MSGRFETARKARPPKPPREKKPRKKLQRPGWKTLLLLILNITLAALSVLCAARLTEYRNLLRTQEAADRWRGQKRRAIRAGLGLPPGQRDAGRLRRPHLPAEARSGHDRRLARSARGRQPLSGRLVRHGDVCRRLRPGGKIERQDLRRRRRFLPVPSLHAPLRLVYCGVRLCAGPRRAG